MDPLLIWDQAKGTVPLQVQEVLGSMAGTRPLTLPSHLEVGLEDHLRRRGMSAQQVLAVDGGQAAGEAAPLACHPQAGAIRGMDQTPELEINHLQDRGAGVEVVVSVPVHPCLDERKGKDGGLDPEETE